MKAIGTPEQVYLAVREHLLSPRQIEIIDSWREKGTMTYFYPMVEVFLPYEDEEHGDQFPDAEIAFDHKGTNTHFYIDEDGAITIKVGLL